MSHAPNSSVERHADVAIVGGSAAGLAAALPLVRQRRSVIVVDAGHPRNEPATEMHGFLGRDGTPPSQLVADGRAEVRGYGGEVLDGTVERVTKDGDRFRLELVGGHAIVARRVVVATGLVDLLPDVEGLAERWGHDVIHCPFCHGYEVRDRRIVQIVTHPRNLHPTPLFRQLTADLTVVVHDPDAVSDDDLAPLRAGGVDAIRGPARRVVTNDAGDLTGVELHDGSIVDADVVAVGPRFTVRIDPFTPLGLRTIDHPSGMGAVVEVDDSGQTVVPGVYAAGNVADPSQQVLHAAADGNRLGATIAFDLANEDLAGASRPSAHEADWDHRYGDEPIWSGNPNGTLVDQVRDLAPGRALDVGSGEGGDAIWLAEHGWKVTANDLSARALQRVAAEAERRGLVVDCHHADANDLDPFSRGAFDLVSAQYASLPRTPDQRAVRNLLDAVAPGGTIVVVSHDLTPMRAPIDTSTQSRAFDPDAYVRVDDVAEVLAGRPDWDIELHETRRRPPGAASSGHHVDDVVLRARRRAT